MLWLTLHSEAVTITEAPMIYKKWKLKEWSTDGMILQRCSQQSSSEEVLLVRPSVPRTMVEVLISEVKENMVYVEAYMLSGKTIYQGTHHLDYSWLDLAMSIWRKDNKLWNVSFIKENLLVPRTYFRQPVAEKIPENALETELNMMGVKDLAVSGELI